VRHWRRLANIADQQLMRRNVILHDEAMAELTVSDLLEQIDLVKPPLRAGQGFVIDPECRQAIERYAVDKAKAYFTTLGFGDIKEKGKPYDLLCSKQSGEAIFVEVKGTTTSGRASMVLYVLSEIAVTKEGDRFILSGGAQSIHWPWHIDRTRLKVLAYMYQLTNI
jgi:Domain of unknown function (DUF3883)